MPRIFDDKGVTDDIVVRANERSAKYPDVYRMNTRTGAKTLLTFDSPGNVADANFRQKGSFLEDGLWPWDGTTGGPINTPQDADRVMQNTDAVGFVGASSLERMGVEASLTNLTREFKKLKAPAARTFGKAKKK